MCRSLRLAEQPVNRNSAAWWPVPLAWHGERGEPRLVRVASLGWERGDGYLEIYNRKSLVFAGRAVGTGDLDLEGFERLS